MAIALFPLLLLIIGLLLWGLATNPLVKEAGKIAYFCGLLVLTFVLAKWLVHIG